MQTDHVSLDGPLVGKGSTRKCGFCLKDIVGVRIMCAECPEPVSICGPCFASGAEFGSHKKTHKYRVADSLTQHPIEKDWSVAEELLLLEGIEMYGFGNWRDVSNHVETQGELACSKHYWNSYLRVSTAPLPVFLSKDGSSKSPLASPVSGGAGPTPSPPQLPASAVGSAGAGTGASGSAKRSLDGAEGSPKPGSSSGDKSPLTSAAVDAVKVEGVGADAGVGTGAGAGAGVGTEAAAASPAPAPIPAPAPAPAPAPVRRPRGRPPKAGSAADRRRRENKAAGESPPLKVTTERPSATHPQVPGCLPLRKDFDVEHDNDAEVLLADMKFSKTDSATETELKLKVLEIYNERLSERERRKKFVFERNLVNAKKELTRERMRQRDAKVVYDKLRSFMPLHPQEDHDMLVKSLGEELRLRRRIRDLLEFRAAGLRTFAEASRFEAAKKRRMR